MAKTFELRVSGVTCQNCERRIETALCAAEGVMNAKADFASGTLVVEGDPARIGLPFISGLIEPLGYRLDNGPPKPAARWRELMAIGAVLAVVVLVIVVVRGQPALNPAFLRAGSGVGYGLLFVIGLVNSLHCVTMCGGINLSLCAAVKPEGSRLSRLLPSLLYNTGRVLSYTLIGGIVGSIGSVINISPGIRGVGAILAGAFMLIMGLGMMDIPIFRKITPKFPKIFGDKLFKRLGSAAPFTVGLLNGLMPCGPLQSVQLYALGTGSFVPGALSMLMFSLGTVPLMFGLGAAGTLLSQSFTGKMMKIGAALVALLGLFMLCMGAVNALR